METITFKKQSNSFERSGEIIGTRGVFEWFDGTSEMWKRTGIVEPVGKLIERMQRSGPYKYTQYRIIEANQPELVIKPTCAGCGVIAGTDCQRACEYIFGRADVTEALPIEFNTDHQFNQNISVVTDGKNFGNKKPKTFWFNSVRCAELFLMEQGLSKVKDVVIGNGERLLAYLSPEVAKGRDRKKRVRASKRAKDAIWAVQTPVSAPLESIA